MSANSSEQVVFLRISCLFGTSWDIVSTKFVASIMINYFKLFQKNFGQAIKY